MPSFQRRVLGLELAEPFLSETLTPPYSAAPPVARNPTGRLRDRRDPTRAHALALAAGPEPSRDPARVAVF